MGVEIPSFVLSEHFEKVLRGRRVVSLVFTTFRFEPGFFESEVLPVFFDLPLNSAAAIRLVQLEDVLRGLEGGVSVYFDRNGLVSGDLGSARLDVRRIPVSHPTGIFHPKNVFALVEEAEADEEGHRPRALLLAAMSANLTRAGWWENVEVCHVEEIPENGKTRLKDDVVRHLRYLRDVTRAEAQTRPIEIVLEFLKGTEQRAQKSSEGQLHVHFYAGDRGNKRTVADFLAELAGPEIVGSYLDVISPYFDDGASSSPLSELIERFRPKETRVFLPRSNAGEALCSKEFFESVRSLPDAGWARLPEDLLRLGASSDAGKRTVHAKVYRFFTQSPKREFLFVGSANLTRAAHGRGGNVETGFFVELTPSRRPESWLVPDRSVAVEFRPRSENEGNATDGGTPLMLRFQWDTKRAEAYWNAPEESPALRLTAHGLDLWSPDRLASREWVDLPKDAAGRLETVLAETSFVDVYEGERKALLLVEEDGMSHKPSILHRLSAAEILKFWSLLTAEQRAAFIEARASELIALPGADPILRQARIVADGDTVFDRFAGFFHAFASMERAVLDAIPSGREKEADYRLFGKKYDSLGSFLDRVFAPDGGIEDPVDRYVLLLCAKQLVRAVRRDQPDYCGRRKDDLAILQDRLEASVAIRETLCAQDDKMAPFLDWFEPAFLDRATVREVVG